MSSIWVIIALVPCVLGGILNPQDNEVLGRSADGFDTALKFLTDCREKDFGTCLGIKAVTVMNRMARMDDLNIIEGVSFIRSGDADRVGRALSESELENSLPEESTQKRSRLIDLFVDAAFRFFKSHSLQLKLPESTSAELERALQEGRGKLKKTILPLIIGVLAKVFAIIPLILGVVALIATKALILSKIALLVAAILALQKIFGGASGGSGGFGGFKTPSWNYGNNSGSWGGSGPYYYRSFNEHENHDLPYSAHAPQSL